MTKPCHATWEARNQRPEKTAPSSTMRALLLFVLGLVAGSEGLLRLVPQASRLVPGLRMFGDRASRTTFEVKRLKDVDWEEIGLVRSCRLPRLESRGPATRVDLTPGAEAAAADLLRSKRRVREEDDAVKRLK